MATSASYWGNYSDKDQPTLGTVADLFADARVQLQDKVPPYRYDDDSLLTALNVTMAVTRRLRPDFFVFDLVHRGQVPAFTAVDGTYIQLEPQFRPAILDGLVGHALKRDQEDVQDSRASSYLAGFTTGLIGRGVGGVVGGSGPERGPQQQGAG